MDFLPSVVVCVHVDFHLYSYVRVNVVGLRKKAIVVILSLCNLHIVHSCCFSSKWKSRHCFFRNSKRNWVDPLIVI